MGTQQTQSVPQGIGPGGEEPGIRIYLTVWIALMALTGLTVAAAGAHLAALAIIVCLVIAAFKSILVLLYFMHLRHEKRLFVKLIIPIAITTLAIFIGLTFSDVITR